VSREKLSTRSPDSINAVLRDIVVSRFTVTFPVKRRAVPVSGIRCARDNISSAREHPRLLSWSCERTQQALLPNSSIPAKSRSPVRGESMSDRRKGDASLLREQKPACLTIVLAATFSRTKLLREIRRALGRARNERRIYAFSWRFGVCVWRTQCFRTRRPVTRLIVFAVRRQGV